MNVESLVLCEIGPMNRQARRSMTFQASSMLSLESFINGTRHGENTTPSAINKLAAGMLTYNPTPDASGTIENGWETSRFNFILKVNRSMAMAGNTQQIDYISGYTDMAINTASFTTKTPDLPPEMVFHITRVMTVNQTTTLDNFKKPVTKAHPVNMTDMLTGSFEAGGKNNELTARVQDAFLYSNTVRWLGTDAAPAADVADLAAAFGTDVTGNKRDPAVIGAPSPNAGAPGSDVLLTFATEPVKPAAGQSVLPSMYLKTAFETLSNVRASYEEGGYPGKTDRVGIYDEAVQNSAEPQLILNPTLNAIIKQTAGYGFEGSATWHELVSLFGTRIRDALDIIPRAQATKGTLDPDFEMGFTPQTSQSWDVVDYPTTYSNSLAVQLLGMMNYRLVDSFKFVADNHGRPEAGILPGQWAVGIKSLVPYVDGFDSNICAHQLRADMITNILPNVLGNDGNRVSFTGSVNLHRDGQLYCSVNDGIKYPYTIANFKPAAISPLISRNSDDIYRLATGLCNLVDAVTDKGNY